MTSLSIYILCHNRPDETRQAICSVLSQEGEGYTLTVSDNSTNDRVEQMMQTEFPGVRYIRRRPALVSLEHFNHCIDEVQTQYFCLFHDDDIMAPNFMREMTKAVNQYPLAIALGCNAVIEEFGQAKIEHSFQTVGKFERFDSPRELAASYFSRAQSGIAPFPGYVYNKKLVENLRFSTDGGKYADVAWLLSLARKGPIVWINKPLMTYRLHGGNDGSVESRRDRLRFLRYLKSNVSWLGPAILSDYRSSFVYKKLLREKDVVHAHRHRIAKVFLKSYHLSRYARLDTYKALATRALVKLIA